MLSSCQSLWRSRMSITIVSRRRAIATVGAASVVGLAACAGSGENWPDFQGSLGPGPTSSRNIARLPDDVSIQQPAAATPPAVQRLSGRWVGWANRNATDSVALALEALGPDSGIMVVAYATSSMPSRSWRAPARVWANGEAQATNQQFGFIVTVRLRSDGNLDFKSRRADGSWVTGVLVRES